jgi:hypothetical protein
MSAGQNKRDSIWKKVGPCLYRYTPSGNYYGLIKLRGKQIRRGLDTNDLPLARRKLQDLRRDLELVDPELARRSLPVQAERFLSTVTGTPSTLYNVRHSISRLPRPGQATLSRCAKPLDPHGSCGPTPSFGAGSTTTDTPRPPTRSTRWIG